MTTKIEPELNVVKEKKYWHAIIALMLSSLIAFFSIKIKKFGIYVVSLEFVLLSIKHNMFFIEIFVYTVMNSIIPLVHSAIFFFIKSKRNKKSMYNILLGWSITLSVFWVLIGISLYAQS